MIDEELRIKTIWITISVLPLFMPEGAWFARQLKKICNVEKFSSDIVVPIVATRGYNNDFAAYIGFPKPEFLSEKYFRDYAHDEKHTIEGCKRVGDKIPETLARQLFPEFAEFVYRS